MSGAPKLKLTPVPPLLGTLAVTKLEISRLLRGWALRIAAGIALFLVISGSLFCLFESGDSRATFVLISRYLIPWVAMGLSLLFAARTISDDVEAGVIQYFFLLPVPRWVVTLGKYLSCALIVTTIMLATTILLYFGTHLAEPSLLAAHHIDLWRGCLASVGAGLCYTAVFMFLGSAVADLPYLFPLLYVAIFEVGFGNLPVLEVVSLRHHINVLLGEQTTTTAEGLFDQLLQLLGLVTPEVPLWVAAVVVATVFIVFLGLALLVTEFSEYRTGRP